jgi:hypothetical protein
MMINLCKLIKRLLIIISFCTGHLSLLFFFKVPFTITKKKLLQTVSKQYNNDQDLKMEIK